MRYLKLTGVLFASWLGIVFSIAIYMIASGHAHDPVPEWIVITSLYPLVIIGIGAALYGCYRGILWALER